MVFILNPPDLLPARAARQWSSSRSILTTLGKPLTPLVKIHVDSEVIPTNFKLGDPFTNALHYSPTLMPQDDGEDPLWIKAIQGISVSVTDTCGLDLQRGNTHVYKQRLVSHLQQTFDHI